MTETKEPAAVTNAVHSEEAGEGGPGEPAQKYQIVQSRPPKYDFAAFESKWRAKWEEQKLYQVDLRHARRPYYNLMMFPCSTRSACTAKTSRSSEGFTRVILPP